MKRSVFGLLASFALLAGCAAAGHETRVGFRFDAVVSEAYDATVSSGTTEVTGETEYDSTQVGVVFSTLDGNKNKASTGEILIGSASYGDLDAAEVVGGGRIFFTPGQGTFGSFHAVTTIFDDVGTTEVGSQLGFRFGLGHEFAIGASGAYVDIGADYTIPLIPAETTFGSVETEVDGIAFRIGVGVDL